MNKADLIEALAPRLGGRAAAGTAVEALVDLILREVAAGGTVGITGFGTFEKVDRAPRTGRNPRTGEAVPIAGTSSPRFRPGSYFKDIVADPSTLPVEGLAGVRGGGSESQAAAAPDGAPPSVRRSGSTRPKGRGAAAGSRPTGSRRRPDSGTPSTVRKSADDPGSVAAEADAPAPAQADAPAAEASGGGRVFAGGEDITASMITAKKAQLAKVKNDEKAKKAKRKDGKKGKKKSKKKD